MSRKISYAKRCVPFSFKGGLSVAPRMSYYGVYGETGHQESHWKPQNHRRGHHFSSISSVPKFVSVLFLTMRFKASWDAQARSRSQQVCLLKCQRWQVENQFSCKALVWVDSCLSFRYFNGIIDFLSAINWLSHIPDSHWINSSLPWSFLFRKDRSDWTDH